MCDCIYVRQRCGRKTKIIKHKCINPMGNYLFDWKEITAFFYDRNGINYPVKWLV